MGGKQTERAAEPRALVLFEASGNGGVRLLKTLQVMDQLGRYQLARARVGEKLALA